MLRHTAPGSLLKSTGGPFLASTEGGAASQPQSQILPIISHKSEGLNLSVASNIPVDCAMEPKLLCYSNSDDTPRSPFAPPVRHTCQEVEQKKPPLQLDPRKSLKINSRFGGTPRNPKNPRNPDGRWAGCSAGTEHWRQMGPSVPHHPSTLRYDATVPIPHQSCLVGVCS